ncbi:MAG: hypothetical protein NXI31_17220 [bacterium]|nr:hypothetical protein [bacterium]
MQRLPLRGSAATVLALATMTLPMVAFANPTLAQSGQVTRPKLAVDLSTPFRVMAGDAAIDVTTGHAAPYLIDWDGDGVRDLLVGEFGDGKFPADELPECLNPAWKQPGNFANGKIRIYRNVGTNGKPRFEDFQFVQSNGSDATVPIT